MAVVGSKRKRAFFEKDPEALPFFSIHPKTKAGTIIRISIYVFIVLVMLMNFVGNKTGIIPAKYWDYALLVYVIPIALVLALVILFFLKRAPSPFLKVLTCVIALFIVMTGGSVISSVMSYQNPLSADTYGISNISPEIKMPVSFEDGTNAKLMFMRYYTRPDNAVLTTVNEGTENEYTEYLYPVSAEADVFTAYADNEACTSDGEIKVQSGTAYNIGIEWTSECCVRFYITDDPAGNGSGEITVTFTGEETAASARTGEFKHFTNSEGTHTVNLYKDAGSLTEMKNIYYAGADVLNKVYVVYPSISYLLIDTSVKSEGSIKLLPGTSLTSVNTEYLGNGVIRFTPGDDITGAEGEITLYLNEKSAATEDVSEAPDANNVQ